MEEIRRAAGAFYEHLPAKDKKLARKKFKAMDKSGDGQISLREYEKYLKKIKATDFTHQSLFRALDKDDNGSLDFDEAFLLFYIMEISTYEICCDCYGGKKFTHHGDATFCDNYTLLRQSRSLALEAPAEKRNVMLKKTAMIVGAAVVIGCNIM
ncbi:hypothetical protein OIU84_027618 [Salix udensis]|uniref:EF-hand domain-containing protein n=1 Tax=Salix udensis TaxID=889485 RepID=A0AAD6KHB5_9ROSI|nr:hypothetical protein OIU84_027618 [Salix udensis]